MSSQTVPEWAKGAILYDDMETCLIGFGTQFDRPIAIYDYDKCVDKLYREFSLGCGSHHDDCDHYSEALEYMSYNVVGAWAGNSTPVFLRREEEEEEPQGCRHCGNVAGGCAC
jgi:hypothetical protein